MGLSTLLLYLVGNEASILRIVRCRHAVGVGLLFVISAGFAREYDGEDLLHEPWHLLLPLGASLVTSFLLAMLLEVAFTRPFFKDETPKEEGPGNSSWCRYQSLLGLYWLTAPLAWIYAIPVERFLPPGNSVRANLAFLGVVSLWRVLLITRAASILYRRSFLATFFVVMLFADSVAMVIFWFTPLPIISVMGGIRLTEAEEVIQSTGMLVRFLGALSWPIWLIGAITSSYRSIEKVPAAKEEAKNLGSTVRASRTSWAVAAASILVWIGVLPFTQPAQIHRHVAERDLTLGKVAAAIAYMSDYEQEDFPIHWDPPPHYGYRRPRPAIDELLFGLEKGNASPWVQKLFFDKIELQLQGNRGVDEEAIRISNLPDERLRKYAQLLARHPLGQRLASYHESELRWDLDEIPTTERLASFNLILAMVPGAKPLEIKKEREQMEPETTESLP